MNLSFMIVTLLIYQILYFMCFFVVFCSSACITKIHMWLPIQVAAIKALLNFWDPSYRCFTFGNMI